MSRIIGCPCGAEQSDVEVSTHNKIHIITDRDLDAITDYGNEPITLDADAFDKKAREAYFCWQCGRLLILENDELRIFEERK